MFGGLDANKGTGLDVAAISDKVRGLAGISSQDDSSAQAG